ncbi:MAG TPA: SHOCT domain-containing protein [Spirochaetota bacterium]|nr:SHOCT domain-containing protein [Spirochaetota bacterium]
MKLFYLILILMANVPVFAHNHHHGDWWNRGMWPFHNYGYGGFIMWIVLIIIVAIGIYMFWQYSKGKGLAGQQPAESALDILKKRYASGEIDKEQYDRMKRELTE